MKVTKDYPKKVKLGIVDGENIYLSAPSWDCGWYWGFGYLGNKNCHYHIDGLKQAPNGRRQDLHTGLCEHFGDSFIIRPSLRWKFAELFQTFYNLQEAAEVLGRGGSHLSSNPCKDIIINTDEVARINEIVLPAIFDEIYMIIGTSKGDEARYKHITTLDGDTKKIVGYMFKHDLKPEDVKKIKGVIQKDYDAIHSLYWKTYHTNKK